MFCRILLQGGGTSMGRRLKGGLQSACLTGYWGFRRRLHNNVGRWERIEGGWDGTKCPPEVSNLNYPIAWEGGLCRCPLSLALSASETQNIPTGSRGLACFTGRLVVIAAASDCQYWAWVLSFMAVCCSTLARRRPSHGLHCAVCMRCRGLF